MTTIVNILTEGLSWRTHEMSRPLKFKVYRVVIDNIEYFRPFEPFMNCEFEEFFHFGPHCEGYTSERVVIKDSQKPKFKVVHPVIISKEGLWQLK